MDLAQVVFISRSSTADDAFFRKIDMNIVAPVLVPVACGFQMRV
jgi:hypothetical protein